MATLQGKKVVIIGGSSGIGYSVAKASLISLSDHIIIASSSQSRVDAAVSILLAEPELQHQANLEDRLSGGTLDLTDTKAIGPFFEKIGDIDHLIITSGKLLGTANFKEDDLDKFRSAFDMRFWGVAHASQKAKIQQGGSITFTIGASLFKPRPTRSLIIGALGSVDALTRALAIDLAPIRVNVVCPGAVNTEQWDYVPLETKEKMLADIAQKLPVKHVAGPDEIAEAYLFLMKCNYITGQAIQADGGNRLV